MIEERDQARTVPAAPIIHSANYVPESVQPRGRRHRLARFLLIGFGILLLLLGSVVLVRAANITNKIFVGQKTSFYKKITEFIRGNTGNVKLIGEDLGQVNILLLGIGGEGHDGGYLTDTMILVQVRPDVQKATLISIPRDYLAELPGQGFRKINNAFAETYLKTKDFNAAGSAARETVAKLSGIAIPYFAVVDFRGFEQSVDLIGGLGVEIERTFTDYQYPDSRYGYLPPITFTKGLEEMNGTRALQFARSRHAAGPEGTDFARSIRQQKILQAFKSKLGHLNLISDASTINNLFSIIGEHFHTNIGPGEIFRLYNVTKNFGNDSIISLSLDPSSSLICPNIIEATGAYVLEPCPGKTAEDIKAFFRNSFFAGAVAQEKSVVWLADSGRNPTYISDVEALLHQVGMTVFRVSFTDQPLDKTVVYTVNQKPESAKFIEQSLSATPVSLAPPGFKINKDKVDLIVILGKKDTDQPSKLNENTIP
jgi:polyisoprenyl-teichoic acid--peptidoglycan teichoic acid transferase